MTSTGVEDTAVLVSVALVDEHSNQRHDPVRLKTGEDLGRHDSLGHSASSCDGGKQVSKIRFSMMPIRQ